MQGVRESARFWLSVTMFLLGSSLLACSSAGDDLEEACDNIDVYISRCENNCHLSVLCEELLDNNAGLMQCAECLAENARNNTCDNCAVPGFTSDCRAYLMIFTGISCQ